MYTMYMQLCKFT